MQKYFFPFYLPLSLFFLKLLAESEQSAALFSCKTITLR